VKDRHHGALRQLWARQRIQMLSDYDQFGQDEARKAEVTRLGLAYNLLTAHTSFVAVDSLVRNTSGSHTTVTQPLPMPEGVSDAAVGGAPAAVMGGVVGGVVGNRAAYAPAPMMKHSASGSAGASAAVEVMAQDVMERKEKAKTAAGPRITAFSGITGTSDPRALRQELDARLLDPSLVAALAGLPSGTTLALKVDGSGQVVAATFDRAFVGSVRAKSFIVLWRLRSWTGGIAGSMELTLG